MNSDLRFELSDKKRKEMSMKIKKKYLQLNIELKMNTEKKRESLPDSI